MTTLRNMKDHQMADQQVAPSYDGDPLTSILTDAEGSLTGITVEPVVLTPLRAKFADFLGVVSAIALSALGTGFVALLTDPAPYCWPIAVITPWLFAILMQKGYRSLLRKRTLLLFTLERFSVSGQAVSYDRQKPHTFRMRLCERAEKEAERHEILETRARMNGRVVRERKYYRDTYTLEYVDGRYPRKIMDILGQRDAERILARVSDVDDDMDRVVAMSDLFASGPSSDWPDMAGKIPGKV